MPDEKYGRLYTEADVLAVVKHAFDAGVNAGQANPHLSAPDQHANYEAITRFAVSLVTPTFPADEPLFLLRAGQISAPDGVLDYVKRPELIAASNEYVNRAVATARAMVEWQTANPDRVKVPD